MTGRETPQARPRATLLFSGFRTKKIKNGLSQIAGRWYVWMRMTAAITRTLERTRMGRSCPRIREASEEEFR